MAVACMLEAQIRHCHNPCQCFSSAASGVSGGTLSLGSEAFLFLSKCCAVGLPLQGQHLINPDFTFLVVYAAGVGLGSRPIWSLLQASTRDTHGHWQKQWHGSCSRQQRHTWNSSSSSSSRVHSCLLFPSTSLTLSSSSRSSSSSRRHLIHLQPSRLC